MARGYNKIVGHFQSIDNTRRLQTRLENDLESVSAYGGRRTSFSNETDLGLPMKKFFQEYHKTGSLAPPTVNEK